MPGRPEVRRLNFIDKNGDPAGIRTRDPLLRRQLLYPAELQGRTYSMYHTELKRIKGKINNSSA